MRSIAVVLALLALTSASHALTIQVPADEPTIQAGIDAADSADTVLVASGTYPSPEGNGGRGINFGGKNVVVLSESGPEWTVITGGSGRRCVTFESGEASSAILDGFTLQDGDLNIGYAGALFCGTDCQPTIRNCRIQWNRAPAGGGIAVRLGGHPNIGNCQIYENSARQGAGIYIIEDSHPSLLGCEFKGNTLQGVSPAGAAVYCSGARVSLTACTVTGNDGSLDGGNAVTFMNGSHGAIVQSTLACNEGGAWGGGAGLIVGEASYITLNTTIVRFNCLPAGFPEGRSDIHVWGGSTLDVEYSAIDPGEIRVSEGGILTLHDASILDEPLFCEPAECLLAPTTQGDFAQCADSPCLPGNNAFGLLIGAHDEGCAPCSAIAANRISWGGVKILY